MQDSISRASFIRLVWNDCSKEELPIEVIKAWLEFETGKKYTIISTELLAELSSKP